jgi:SnoaL-like domain
MAIERAPEIEAFLREAGAAFQRGDASFFERFTSRHESALVIGSDASEISRGYSEIIEMLSRETQARTPESPRLAFDDVEAYREGDVGWAIILGRYQLVEGAAIPARVAAVLHREDGEWRLLSWCFSFAVPNDEIQPGSPFVQRAAIASG